MNDLPTGDQRGTSQFQFADDIAVSGKGKNGLLAVRKVQEAVNDIEGWCRRWRVKLNGEKSHLVILSRKRKKLNENLCVHLFNDIVRPVSKAKFLGVEIDSSLRFKDHFQDLALRAEKRLNILRILAWGGTEPKTLLRLYKIYIRSIFEYGSVSFLHCPESSFDILQKIQNRAIRICLRLPGYISVKLLHESACLPTVRERLIQQGTSLLAKMRQGNPLIYDLILKHERSILQNILRGRIGFVRSHRSPLDIILPAQ